MPSHRQIRRAQIRLAVTLSGFAVALLVSGCGSGIGASIPASSSTPTTAIPNAVKSGPQLGYIWSEKNHTLRPVLGVPGSSQLGQSVVPADLYIAAASSAASNLAILQESDGVLDLIALPSGAPVRLSATLAPSAQIRFSPSGLYAVAFTPGASSATLFTSLAAFPKSQAIPLGSPVSDAAVSDSGTVASALQSGSIRTIALTGASAAAGSVGSIGGMSFVGSTENLLFADTSGNSVTLVRNSTSSPTPVVLPSASLLKSPQGVAATYDGHYAVLANTADPSIVRVDLTAQTAPQSFACACKPSLVAQLSGTGVFRVTPADSGPAWMFDASASTPRVLFIPAIASANSPVQN